jgi:WD40 repeat protein
MVFTQKQYAVLALLVLGSFGALCAMDEHQAKRRKTEASIGQTSQTSSSSRQLAQVPLSLEQLLDNVTQRSLLDVQSRKNLCTLNKQSNRFPQDQDQLQLLCLLGHIRKMAHCNQEAFEVMKRIRYQELVDLPRIVSQDVIQKSSIPVHMLTGGVWKYEMSRDGESFVIIRPNRSVEVYRMGTLGPNRISLNAPSGANKYSGVAISPSSELIALADTDGMLHLYQLKGQSLRLMHTVNQYTHQTIEDVVAENEVAIAFNQQENCLAACNEIGLIRLYTITRQNGVNQEAAIQLQCQETTRNAAEDFLDGHDLYFTRCDSYLCLKYPGQVELFHFDFTKQENGESKIAFDAQDEEEFYFDRDLDADAQMQCNAYKDTDYITFLYEGRFLAVRKSNGIIAPYIQNSQRTDIDLGNPGLADGKLDKNLTYALHKNGDKVFVGARRRDIIVNGYNYFIRVYGIDNKDLITSIPCEQAIEYMAASSNGDMLASVHSDASLMLWDTRNCSQIKLLKKVQLVQLKGAFGYCKHIKKIGFMGNDRCLVIQAIGDEALLVDVGIISRLSHHLSLCARSSMGLIQSLFIKSLLKLFVMPHEDIVRPQEDLGIFEGLAPVGRVSDCEQINKELSIKKSIKEPMKLTEPVLIDIFKSLSVELQDILIKSGIVRL